MKQILKSFLAIVCGVMFFASCEPDVELLASQVGADQTELTFAAQNASTQTFNVTANGDWLITASDWITVTPACGLGKATVTVKVEDNVDAEGVMGPRTGEITIAGTDVTSSITVNQLGNKKRDLRREYVLAKKIEDGRSYLIVSPVDGKLLAASPLSASKTYGYLYDPIEVTLKDDKIAVKNGDNGFLFTAVEGEEDTYYIQQGSDGRYMYQTTYDSFNVTSDPLTEGSKWVIKILDDGTAKIFNKTAEKFWQYSTTYSSWGSYAAAGKGVMPVLYQDTKVSKIEVLTCAVTDVTVDSDATQAEFTINTNVDWTVKCDDDWIKSYTPEGTADPEEKNPQEFKITVTFDEWDNMDEPRTATFFVEGTAKDVTLTLTQKKKPAPSQPLPYEEAFGTDCGAFTINDVEKGTLEYVWKWASAAYGMKASAFANNTNVASESWLISPPINLTNVDSAVLTFDHTYKYTTTPTTDLTLWATSDAGETWRQLKIPVYPTGSDWNFVNSGQISLKSFAKGIVQLAFVYKSTDSAAATWEIKNVKVFEGEAVGEGIASIREAITSTSSSSQDEFVANLTNAVVSYVNGNNAYVEDANAGILIYLKNHGLTAGQTINGKVSGSGYVYNGLKEIAAIDLTAATVTDGGTIYESVVTIEELLANFDNWDSRRIVIKNATMSDGIAQGDRNGTVAQGDKSIAVYAKVNGPTIETGAIGDLTCWPVYNKTTMQVGVWDTEHFKAAAAAVAGIAGIRTAITSTSSSKPDSFSADLTDAVVSYINGNNVYVEDAEAGILIYNKNHGMTVGQKINGRVTGEGYVYNGLKEITTLDLTSATVETGATPYQHTVTLAELLANFDNWDSRRILLEGITMADGIAEGDRNGTVAEGDATIPAYAKVNGPTIATGAVGDLLCWPVYNKTTKQVGIWDTEHFTDKSPAAILLRGEDFNLALKHFVNPTATDATSSDDADNTIKKIFFVTGDLTTTTGTEVQAADSPVKAYANYDADTKTVTISTPGPVFYTNADASSMFRYMQAVTLIDNIAALNTENTTTMAYMFQYCQAIQSLPLATFNTAKCTSFSRMFNKCTAATMIDVSGWNTENVTDMWSMFNDCGALTSLDMRSWNTSKVTTMSYMFYKNYAMTEYDLSSFTIGSSTVLTYMFSLSNHVKKMILGPGFLKSGSPTQMFAAASQTTEDRFGDPAGVSIYCTQTTADWLAGTTHRWVNSGYKNMTPIPVKFYDLTTGAELTVSWASN